MKKIQHDINRKAKYITVFNGFCPQIPYPPSPVIMWGRNWKMCQNFERTIFYIYGGINLYDGVKSIWEQ